MTHIGIDIRVLSSGRVSGVEEYTRQLLAHMLSLDGGIRFTLLSVGHSAPAHEEWMSLPNVRVLHKRWSSRATMASMRLIGMPRLDVMADRPAVFFFPHFLFGALSRPCRRVITFHDLSFERFPEFFSLRRRLWHSLQMRPRVQAQSADRLIAVSHSTANDLMELYGIAPEKIDVVYSGVDPSIMRIPEHELAAFRRYRGLPGRFILSLCTREPRKNLIGLVRAFELIAVLPDCRDVGLVLAGADGWMSGALERIVRRSPYAGRIRMVGAVPRNECASWYSAASVFAYPSFFEGFGFPPLEAMACGTPVVASHNSSLPEVVGDAGILVDPYDPAALGHVLGEVLRDGSLHGRLREKGKLRAGSFSWQMTAERTLDVLVRTGR